MKRNRVLYALAILLVITVGLLSRLHPQLFFQSLGKYPGDALWAMMAFVAFGLLFPRKPTEIIGLMACLFSFTIELSQLYHAPWIDSIRATTLGHLVLGSAFSWIDLVAYMAGVLVACLFEIGLFNLIRNHGR